MKYRKTAIAVGVAAAIVLGIRMVLPGPPPSDAEMLNTFREKRAVFDELVARMCTGDTHKAVMMDPERSKPQIGEEEKQEFYRLFNEIGAKGAEAGLWQGRCSLGISAWAVGLGGDGDYKGYQFGPLIEEDETEWVESLDQVDRSSLDHGVFARKIDDDWSLYFHHWP